MNRSLQMMRQRGATLIVGLVMLLLLTLMVSGAFVQSISSHKAVGNMQVRDEAVMAANVAIEQVIGSAFTTAPTAEEINVDLNNDGNRDYVVSMLAPVCQRATLATAAAPSSLSLGAMSNSTWNTVWGLDATVNDPASGARARVRSGVRVLLTDAQKNAVCP
ncbi:hypothetical protein [Pseudomonas taiwanensis]|uniref:hypothetical protein n=1 Tax=Pseudomonas taiwanensis TaxID=470150 RepID=UPI00356B6CCA